MKLFKNLNRNTKRVIVLLVSLVLVFSLSIGGGYVGYLLASNNSTNGNAQIIKTSATESATNDISTIAASCSDSVVEITTESVSTGNFMRQYVSEGAGSGVIITEDGYIVTNYHVIDGATSIVVTLNNEKEYKATLIGGDSDNDIAVLKIDESNLTVAAVGDSDNLVVGESVVAIGNPLGELGGTVTEGIISATSREITIDGVNMTLLQTSAAINPGNSGGGLFNTNGELIGIVNAKSSGSDVEGLGFAIPSNTAIKVAEDIIKNKDTTSSSNSTTSSTYVLGIQMVEINSESLAQQYGVDEQGVYVYELVSGSDAESMGIKSGDLLVSINGTEIDSASTAKAIVQKLSDGDTLKVVIKRDGKKVTLKTTVKI